MDSKAEVAENGTRHSSKTTEASTSHTNVTNDQVSLLKDVKHDLQLNAALMPGYLMVGVWVAVLFLVRYFLRDIVQVQVYATVLLFLGTTGYVFSFLTFMASVLTRLELACVFVISIFTSFGLVLGVGGHLLKEGIISEQFFLLLGPALSCGMLSWIGGAFICKMPSVCSRVLISMYILPPAVLGTLLSYGHFTFVLLSSLDPMIEVLIGGVAYPLAVALVGKVMLCDFSAYLIHYACKVDYVEAVDFMVCFMRILLFMNLQAAVFMLDSFPSFVLASTSNIMIELAFLPFNVKVATLDNVRRIIMKRQAKVQPKKRNMSRSNSIVQSWFAFDRLPPGTRFGRHYYNEAIAEKVSLIGVIVIGFTLQMGADETRILQLVGRSLLLIVFEFMEDLLKRRLLYHLLNVNMMDIEINIDWKTNLKLSGFVAMSASFLLIGETLANIIQLT